MWLRGLSTFVSVGFMAALGHHVGFLLVVFNIHIMYLYRNFRYPLPRKICRKTMTLPPKEFPLRIRTPDRNLAITNIEKTRLTICTRPSATSVSVCPSPEHQTSSSDIRISLAFFLSIAKTGERCYNRFDLGTNPFMTTYIASSYIQRTSNELVHIPKQTLLLYYIFNIVQNYLKYYNESENETHKSPNTSQNNWFRGQGVNFGAGISKHPCMQNLIAHHFDV